MKTSLIVFLLAATGFQLLNAQSAASGPAQAEYAEGMKYLKGDSVEKDAAKAVDLLTTAADAGNTAAMVELAGCYEKGLGCLKDDARAVELLTEAAGAGNGVALRLLGGRYWNGNGVTKELAKAHELYQKAGDAGNGQALVWLASDYLAGNGVEKSFAKYEELMLKAGEKGFASAFNDLGVCYQNGDGVAKDLTKANEYYQKAGALGAGMGYRRLGVNYENGIGVTKDPAKANEYYLKAGDLGDSEGYIYLGNNFWAGRGVDVDQTKANMYYLRAAELGNLLGMVNIGTSLRDGTGIAKDLAKAVEWIQKSSDGGNAYGQYNLGKCYSSGRGMKKDMAKAVELFTKAAEQNLSFANYDLGTCYENGLGCARDLTKARELYEKAASLGHAEAQQRLKDLGPAKKASTPTKPVATAKPAEAPPTKKAATTSPAGPVPNEVTAKLTAARKLLDEERADECAELALAALALLDRSNPGHSVACLMASATLTAAHLERGQECEEKKTGEPAEWYFKALEAAQAGYLPETLMNQAKKSAPDRCARLMEQNGAALAALSSRRRGDNPAEADALWVKALAMLNEALALAQGPLFKSSIQCTASTGYFKLALQGMDSAQCTHEAMERAANAVQLVEGVKGAELYHAKALLCRATAAAAQSKIKGTKTPGEALVKTAVEDLRKAKTVFDELIPGTSYARSATRLLTMLTGETSVLDAP